ncbi:MAG: hypothetical protein U0228_13900 [Myxococcaceae bacterium]
MRTVTALLFCCLSLGCERGPSKEELAKSDALATAAKAKLDERVAHRTAALTKAYAELVPRADLGPCPVKIEPMPSGPPKSFDLDRMTRQLRTLERLDLEFVRPEDLAVAPGPLLRGALDTVSRARTLPLATATQEIGKVMADDRWDWDLVVVEGLSKKSKGAGDGKTFEGGFFIGTAYLYDYAKDAVTCVADLTVETPKQVKVRTLAGASKETVSNAAASQADLELKKAILAKACTALVSAGPVAESGN